MRDVAGGWPLCGNEGFQGGRGDLEDWQGLRRWRLLFFEEFTEIGLPGVVHLGAGLEHAAGLQRDLLARLGTVGCGNRGGPPGVAVADVQQAGALSAAEAGAAVCLGGRQGESGQLQSLLPLRSALIGGKLKGPGSRPGGCEEQGEHKEDYSLVPWDPRHDEAEVAGSVRCQSLRGQKRLGRSRGDIDW